MPLGARFYDSTWLDIPDQAVMFELVATELFAGDADGQWVSISASVDPAFGAYAYYQPGTGPGVIFREGQGIVAAYLMEDGTWWHSPMGYNVDFRDEVSIGLVTGMPWVTFNDRNGLRYVVAFDQRIWQEVGSGR